MADVSLLSRLINGVQRNVDLSQNSLIVGSLKVGTSSPTELTKTILNNLVNLQNGTDFANGTNAHTHDGRYFTETELSSTGATSGADRIGVNNTPSNYSAAAQTVQDHLEGIDAALASAGGTSFSDAMFEIYDDGDITKKITFQASGIATGTSRIITMPNANVDLGKVLTAIQRDGSVAFTANQPLAGFKFTGLGAGTTAGDSVRYEQAILTSGANAFAAAQSMGGFKLINVADPTSNGDAVNLSYLNARIAGVKPKTSARVASLANVVIASALENGDTLDGVTLATGDRVLLKNQTAPEQNGIYIVAASGAAARSADFDSVTPIDEINGAWLAVQEGTQAGQIFVQFGSVAVIDTDPVTFEYWNPIAGLIGGDMITFSGSTFSVDLASDAGLESSNPGNAAGQLRVKLDGSTLSRSSSGLKVAALGITNAEISNSAAIAYSKLALTNSIVNADIAAGAAIAYSKLALTNSIVNADIAAGAAIAYSKLNLSNSLVAGDYTNASVTAAKLNSDVADQDSITGGAGSALAVQHAPLLSKVMVAGESFAADTTFLVRMAVNGETAGRVYKADNDATSLDNFYVVGWARSVAGVSAGGNIIVYMHGSLSNGSGDSAFGGTDIGKPVYLGAAGAFTVTAPSSSNLAAVRVGMVETTSRVMVMPMQLNGIN